MMSENITSQQLRWRTVKMMDIKTAKLISYFFTVS